MQKKIIVLAVAGAIAGLAAGAAFADATVYGRADYGYMSRSGNSGGVTNAVSKSELTSGINGTSRLGFKGSEDLGNGNKAIFEIEYGLANDQTAPTLNATGATAQSNSATFNNRHSYVGMTGAWGTAVGGRLDGVRYGIWNKYDAFGGNTLGNITQISAGQVDRADNAVAYISPSFAGGFTVTAAYSTNIAGAEGSSGGYTGTAIANGAAVGNKNDLKLNTIMGNYNNGPIDATLDYETVKSKDSNNGLNLEVAVMTIGGSYDFGVAKIAGLYDTHDVKLNGPKVAKDRAWMLSAKVPFAGQFVGKLGYGQSKDDSTANTTVKKTSIGVDYNLSKRTTVFADYGDIKNDSGTSLRISPVANSYATMGSSALTNAQIGTKGFDIGIGHNF